jgi:hypothetical protein
MSKVVRFYPREAAKDPDLVLEQAIGIYDRVVLVGYNKSGALDVRASLNFSTRDIFFAMETFRFKVLNGDYGDEASDE